MQFADGPERVHVQSAESFHRLGTAAASGTYRSMCFRALHDRFNTTDGVGRRRRRLTDANLCTEGDARRGRRAPGARRFPDWPKASPSRPRPASLERGRGRHGLRRRARTLSTLGCGAFSRPCARARAASPTDERDIRAFGCILYEMLTVSVRSRTRM
jgi:hypothetical protein